MTNGQGELLNRIPNISTAADKSLMTTTGCPAKFNEKIEPFLRDINVIQIRIVVYVPYRSFHSVKRSHWNCGTWKICPNNGRPGGEGGIIRFSRDCLASSWIILRAMQPTAPSTIHDVYMIPLWSQSLISRQMHATTDLLLER